jgi:site-specific DNA-methyltransferase (adenine-specific)
MTSEVFLMDCMEGMKLYPDKYFDLAVVDPPYGIGITKQSLGEGGGLYRKPKTYKRGEWDLLPPTDQYFYELQRVSKNQIVWGGNYFNLSPTPCFIFWDKNNGGSDFADGELAWTSFNSPVRKFKYTWSGFIQGGMGTFKEDKIHPTQKPIALYSWIYAKYLPQGGKVIDTHGEQ